VVQRSLAEVGILSAVEEVGAELTSGPGVSSVHVNNVRPGLQGFPKKGFRVVSNTILFAMVCPAPIFRTAG